MSGREGAGVGSRSGRLNLMLYSKIYCADNRWRAMSSWNTQDIGGLLNDTRR
jgi:hypothetical protein